MTRWDRLATYNAETARGIVHTPQWVALMEREQERFNTEAAVAAGVVPDPTPPDPGRESL